MEAGQQGAPWAGYDGQDGATVRKELKSRVLKLLNEQQALAKSVLAYERGHKKRRDVVESAYLWSNLALITRAGWRSVPPPGTRGWEPGNRDH